ncbi:MAG: PP2C family protein-serine/threonine phosphatase [Solirubrobacterales bacterium]
MGLALPRSPHSPVTRCGPRARSPATPQRALAELNEALLNQPGTALCSVAAFTLDQPAHGEVRVAVAGHPPPLLIQGEDAREIHPAGPILGAFDNAGWEIETLNLEPGDRLLVYTDGVVEARGRTGRFGEDRLCRCAGVAGDPDETIRRISSELDEFAAGELVDDAAAIAVMLEDGGGEPEVRREAVGSRVVAGAGVSSS